MIDCGWAHGDLVAMDEEEFLFWLTETLSYNERVAEARRKASEDGRGE